MKIFKIILSIIIGLAIIIVAGSLFLPKNSRIERSVMIATTDTVAFNYVADFNTFNSWSPWYEMDPAAKIEITGNAGAIGSMYAWKGKEVGEGNILIIKLNLYKEVFQKLTFIKPFEGDAANNFTFESQNDSTKVTWIYDGENKGIMAKWMGLCMDGMMRKDFDKGLNKLKTDLEKK